MRRVFITTRLSDAALMRLAAVCEPVVFARADEGPPTRAELIRGASGCFGLLSTPRDLIDGAVLDATGVRIVAHAGENVDHIDLEAARARRVWVTHTPGVAVDSVADLAMLLMLGLMRRAFEGDRRVRSGRLEPLVGIEPRQRTLGIIGLGRVGRAVARRAGVFGMRVIHHGGNSGGVAAQRCDLDTLLGESDVVSLHARLSPATVGLIGQRELKLMRPGALLINTARAAIVDTDALVIALQSGALAGYALDVGGSEREGRGIDPRLAVFDQVIATPRLGASTLEVQATSCERAIDNLLTALAGVAPPDRVA